MRSAVASMLFLYDIAIQTLQFIPSEEQREIQRSRMKDAYEVLIEKIAVPHKYSPKNAKISFQILENRTPIIIFDSAVKAWAYEISRTFGENNHEESIKCANLVHELWLKDSNETPVGHLCDYVSKHFRRFEQMTKHRCLDEFYAHYKNEDYE